MGFEFRRDFLLPLRGANIDPVLLEAFLGIQKFLTGMV